MSMMELGGAAPSQPFSEPPAEKKVDIPAMLREALDLIRTAAQEADDDVETLDYEKITTLIQKVLADSQKEQEGMLQGKMSPKAMRQAYGGI